MVNSYNDQINNYDVEENAKSNYHSTEKIINKYKDMQIIREDNIHKKEKNRIADHIFE